MSHHAIQLDSTLYEYLLSVSPPLHPALLALGVRTALLPGKNLTILPEQIGFLSFLVRWGKIEHILELGTFTGYSALCFALAMPETGEIITCDINEEMIEIGRPFWNEAGVSDKIKIRIGPALETIADLEVEGLYFDLIFIDADKANYPLYYEVCLSRLKPGGMILIDNVLWQGKVSDSSNNRRATVAIRQLNEIIARDSRIYFSVIPLGDGMTLVYKR